MEKTYEAIMVGYAENNTCNTYKIYNPETKQVIMIRQIKWEDWKRLIRQNSDNKPIILGINPYKFQMGFSDC